MDQESYFFEELERFCCTPVAMENPMKHVELTFLPCLKHRDKKIKSRNETIQCAVSATEIKSTWYQYRNHSFFDVHPVSVKLLNKPTDHSLCSCNQV